MSLLGTLRDAVIEVVEVGEIEDSRNMEPAWLDTGAFRS
jgi:hypothetical protein